MKCFVCDKDLECDLLISSSTGIVYDGVEWTTQGNYGSSFDIDSGELLKIVICDSCIINKKDKILKLKITKVKDIVTQESF